MSVFDDKRRKYDKHTIDLLVVILFFTISIMMFGLYMTIYGETLIP